MVAIIFDRNADPDSFSLWGVKIYHYFLTFGFTKFKPMVLKIETFLTSQNFIKDRKLLVVCSEVQKYGVFKTYLGIVISRIDPPDFLPILTKFSINCR